MFDAEDIALFFARLLLAIMFVVSAVDKFRLDPVEMGQISSLHLPAPAALERVTGVFEMVGATALVLGVYARVAAVALALFVAFVSLMFVHKPAQSILKQAQARDDFEVELVDLRDS